MRFARKCIGPILLLSESGVGNITQYNGIASPWSPENRTINPYKASSAERNSLRICDWAVD